MPLNIRHATCEDAALILRFITELAIYERAEHEVKTDVAGIESSLFAEGASANALICERDGLPIGYAVYFFNYSTGLAVTASIWKTFTSRPRPAAQARVRRCSSTWHVLRCLVIAVVSSGRCWTGMSRQSSSMSRSARGRRRSGPPTGCPVPHFRRWPNRMADPARLITASRGI